MRRSRPLRLRLWRAPSEVVEFSASDAASFRSNVLRAFERFCEQYPPRYRHREAEPIEVQLQVAPPLEADRRDWAPPLRGGTYVVVKFSRDLFERRPADDNGDFWEWCEATRDWDEKSRVVLQEITALACDTIPEDEHA